MLLVDVGRIYFVSRDRIEIATPHTRADGATTPVDSYTTPTVVLPKDISTVYLHSDKLAGYRDTMGPVPGQRGTSLHRPGQFGNIAA